MSAIYRTFAMKIGRTLAPKLENFKDMPLPSPVPPPVTNTTCKESLLETRVLKGQNLARKRARREHGIFLDGEVPGLRQRRVLLLLVQGNANRERPHMVSRACEGGFAEVHSGACLSQQTKISCQARHVCNFTYVFLLWVSQRTQPCLYGDLFGDKIT